MKLFYLPYIFICTPVNVAWSYVPAIQQVSLRTIKVAKLKLTSLRSTYGNQVDDPYNNPIDPYNGPYQQNNRYQDPAYRENYYGWNPSEPVRPSVDERAYRDPLYNYDTPASSRRRDWQYGGSYKNEYQMGPSSGVKTHYEAGVGGKVQDGDRRGTVTAFTYGPSDQSERPKAATSVDSPYGISIGQDENYRRAYDPAYEPGLPNPNYYQTGEVYDYNTPPSTFGPPSSSLTHTDYSDFTFGPGSSIASKGPKPLQDDPRRNFDGGMLFSEEERRVNPRVEPRVSRRAPSMPNDNEYSRSYDESPRPFDYGPDSSVNANRYGSGAQSFAYGPESSVTVDGRRFEPNESSENFDYGPSSNSPPPAPRVDERSGNDNRWGAYNNAQSTSRQTSYGKDQENDEDLSDVFATRHEISQEIKNLMQTVMLGKKSKVPEVVQGALQARQEIKELLALSKRNLERQISKLETLIDEMDISQSKVEACLELESLKKQLEHERKVQKEMDMEIGDILSPSSPLFNLHEPEVVTKTPFDRPFVDDRDRRSYQAGPPRGGPRRRDVSTIRSGNTTYTRNAPPFQYGPGSSIATAIADLDYESPIEEGRFGAQYTSQIESDSGSSSKSIMDDTRFDGPKVNEYDGGGGPQVSSKPAKDKEVVEKWKRKWGDR